MPDLLDAIREIGNRSVGPSTPTGEMFLRFLPLIAGWFLLHFYLGRRLLPHLGLTASWRRVMRVVFVLAAVLPPAAMFTARGRWRLPVLDDAFRWVAFASMGASTFAILLTLLRDFGLLAWKSGRRVARGRRPATAPDPSRRAVLTRALNVGIIASASSAAGLGATRAQVTPEVVRIDIPLAGLPADAEGFTIAQITDLHVGDTIRRDFVERVVATTNALGADVIAVTGDLADGYAADLAVDVAPLAALSAREGVYFVTGNHEYYWNTTAWLEVCAKLGFTILRNEHRVIHRGSAAIVLAGVYDHRAGRYDPTHASDPHRAIAGAPVGAPRILLAHQPRSVFEAAAAGFDLQISGHTHGGQYFPLNLLIPFFEPYVRGLHRHDGRMWIYVSRGTGYWGPPQRLGVGSEITLFRLVRA